MKIIEVLERVQTLYPHGQTVEEMIYFANELGATLSKSDMKRYNVITLHDGEALPEGVESVDVEKVIIDGREAIFDDICRYEVDYTASGRLFINLKKSGKAAEITYVIPYSPIRYIRCKGEISGDTLRVSNEYDIRKDDLLKIGEKNVFVKDDPIPTDNKITMTVSETVGDGEYDIERMIDELTLIGAPFDKLWVYYLASKAARCKKDGKLEFKFANDYNALLEEYRKYKTRKSGRSGVTKMYNWW